MTAAIAALLLQATAGTALPADTVPLSLSTALERARAVSPAVLSARGLLAAAQGARAEAFWPFPSNPRISFERTRRTPIEGGASPAETAGGTFFDHRWQVSQTLEVAGQNFLRASAAGARVAAARSVVAEAGRQAAREASLAFLAARMAVRRRALLAASDSLAGRLERMARRRFAAGDIGRLDYNAAILDAARSRARLEEARAERDTALAQLGRVLGLPPDSAPRPAALPDLPAVSAGDSALLSIARRRRPDLGAARQGLEAAHEDLTLAHRSLVPDLVLTGFTGPEEQTSTLGFSVGIEVPLFHRGQAAVGRAEEAESGARAAVMTTERALAGEVRAAAARFRRDVAAARTFGREALRAADENARLSERALEAGELGVPDVVTLREQALQVQLEHLGVLARAYAAWFDLAAALDVEPQGLPPLLETRGTL